MNNPFIKNNFVLFFTFSICLFIAGCSHSGNTEKENSGIKATVRVAHPVLQNINENIQLNGVTLLLKKDNIRSTITGYITSLTFKQGDYIKKGEVFCNIGTKEQQALKDIAASDSSLSKFQKTLVVISNATGVITSIKNLQGDYVSEGDILAMVSEPTSLMVQVNVPFEYNQFVSAGKNCDIILPGGKIIKSTIGGSMPTVDAATQAQSFYIRLPEQSLPENLNVTILIPFKQKSNVLCVPSSALQTDDMQKEFWLMKVVNDSMAIKVIVETGLQNDSMTEISSDKISVKDKIIIEGAYGLSDSTFVFFNH